ncbi:hypothetical protein BJF90_13920 [Pseudonocardia sp. CNS-004]|nr:hypothetical protein BJF90_13920 [Pseudonocardia sp. CNS-004]
MEYTTLGGTGSTVSRLGFGGAALGLTNYLERFDPADPDDRRGLFEAIDVALDVGINHFDTAAGYGNGESERVLGEALAGVAESGGLPIVLSTKVQPRTHADDVRGSLEGSLERLRRDRVDLLQIHGDSITTEQADRYLAPGGMVEQLLSSSARAWWARSASPARTTTTPCTALSAAGSSTRCRSATT